MKNILCATDDNYVPYCGIMLTSLFKNNYNENIHVFILTAGISKSNQTKLNELANTYSQTIDIIIVNAESFKKCPIRPDKDHVSIATYYRLAVTELLPKDIDRILYLDCDMIIHNSIKELYDVNLSQYACAAVKDEAFFTNAPYERLEIVKDLALPYFNAGMLLINLGYWRKHNVMERCMNYIAENSERLTFHDQDVLNGVLFGHIKYLKPAYNLQTGFLYTTYFVNFDSNLQQEIREAISSPVIIHYTGYSKPWQEISRHPYTTQWRYYKNQSLWEMMPLIKSKFHIKSWLLGLRNEIIWKLGIKHRPQSYIVTHQI